MLLRRYVPKHGECGDSGSFVPIKPVTVLVKKNGGNLIDTAIKNIEGDISIDEAQELFDRSMHISGMFEETDIEKM